ncbi:MAG: cation diffusion facilitator family transporter [Clostridiales bacterium]|nr:cation diffusion facilitator family transporter [Clostridiales bacterium]
MELDPKTKAKIAYRVSWTSVWGNVLLAAFKLAAGLLAHSSAMVSDAVHSASDVFSTFTVMIGVKLSSRQADADHEYGHERLECIASLLLAALLAVTGLGIGYSGIQKIAQASYGQLEAPGRLALVAAVVSIVCKEAMYWYTRRAAKQTGSSALLADAWHHRSDALSSIGSLIGIWGARMGWPVLDPAVSLVICLFILKVSYDVFRQAVNELTDRSCPAYIEEEMRLSILRQAGVERLDLLRTRQFGTRVYVDVEIAADGDLPLTQAHGIAQRVHDTIEREFPSVKHCMVHVNPISQPETD